MPEDAQVIRTYECGGCGYKTSSWADFLYTCPIHDKLEAAKCPECGAELYG